MTFFAGTFARHPLMLAATAAVLKRLKTARPSLQEWLPSAGQFTERQMEVWLSARLGDAASCAFNEVASHQERVQILSQMIV